MEPVSTKHFIQEKVLSERHTVGGFSLEKVKNLTKKYERLRTENKVMEEIYNSQGGRGQPKRRSLTFTDDIVNLTGEKVEVDEKGYNPPMSYGNCCRL